MTSPRRRDNDHSMFTSKTPHFFKVILHETIRDGILGIPRHFVRKYGKQLSSPIQLEAPSGAKWQVELTMSDERVWLQKGWKEFAQHYSLEYGSFVVFRYEGNAHFHVLIFDRSALEIEYPHTSTEDDDDNRTSVELYADVSASRKLKKKSDFPFPQPQKKMRTDSPNETGSNSKLENLSSHVSPDDPNSRRINLGNLKSNKNSRCSTGQVDATTGVGGITAQRSVKTEVLSCLQRLTATEKAHVVQRASAFKNTENPVFMAVMRSSYVSYKYRMCIPSNFARKFLTMEKGNLTLCDSTGKTWPAKYYHKKSKAHMHGGWRAFAEDNNLDVGDICVFELIKHPEILMKVAIYPAVDNARKVCKSLGLADGSVANRVGTRSLVTDTEPNRQQSQCPSSSKEFKDPKPESVDFQYLRQLEGEFKYSAKHENGGISGVRRCLKPDLTGKMQPLTATEKRRACTRASAFKPANPSFTVVMQPSYVLPGGSLNIPHQFAKRYLKKNGEITLRVSDGRTWIINYKRKVSSFSAGAKFRSKSWSAFVLDNNLKVGDILLFELIEENRILLEVAIFSAADIASWSSSRLVSRKSEEKSHLTCSVPKKKMRTDSPNQPGTISKLEVLSPVISPDNDPKKAENSSGQLHAQGSVKTEVLSCFQSLTASEKAHAVQISSAFNSTKNPIFMVVMQRSFVHHPYRMFIPSNFARKLTMQNGDLTLCDSAGKTWPAKYYCTAENKRPNAHMHGGWRAFVEDNNLDVGDICVFELIKYPEILMKVVIYPVVKNASKTCSPLTHGSIASRVKTRSLLSDTEPNCKNREFKDMEDSYIEILDDSPPNQKTKKKLTSPYFQQPSKMTRTNPSGSVQAKGIKLEEQKNSVNFPYLTKELEGEFKYSAKGESGEMSGGRRYPKPDLMGKMQALTPAEKQRACLRASAFRSANPSFIVVMQPSYVLSCSSLHIPEQFAKTYFHKNAEIILRVSDGRTWIVDYKTIASNAGRKATFRSRRWKTFVLDNELKVGDVCVFELIKQNANLLEVTILSAVEIAS